MQLRRRNFFITALCATFALTVIMLQTDLGTDLYYVHWKSLDDISCHYSEKDDALPSGDGIKFSSESIFFHETSCKGGLDARQACAVESAARAHPERQINVLFMAPATVDSLRNCSRVLEEYRNVNFYRIHLVQYATGTPLEKFVADGALNRTRWRIHHASDVLRYLTLYKWGGVYLDLDVVVARNLGSLARNWAARESETAVAAGAMAFSQDSLGRRVARDAVRDIRRRYRGDSWGNNGPGVITRVLRALCGTDHPTEMTTATCKGFEVYSPQLFYPIAWQEGGAYFEPGRVTLGPYVFHVWNHRTQRLRVASGSPYDQLARTFCPIAYKLYRDHFGLMTPPAAVS